MQVAVLGLGHMGAPIAERLERSGHELSVWNRSPGAVQPFSGRGIRALDRPAQAWDHGDVAITMLADGAAVQDVVLGPGGLLDGSQAGLVIDMSTISDRTSASVAAECERHGAALLAAPVTGNPSVVVAGNLGIIVSGPRDQFERVREMLADIGPNVMYVGGAHEARIVEARPEPDARRDDPAARGGTGPRREARHRALRDARGDRSLGDRESVRQVQDRCAQRRRLQLDLHGPPALQGMALALQAAHDRELPLPLTASTQQLVEGCIASGMGDLDISAAAAPPSRGRPLTAARPMLEQQDPKTEPCRPMPERQWPRSKRGDATCRPIYACKMTTRQSCQTLLDALLTRR